MLKSIYCIIFVFSFVGIADSAEYFCGTNRVDNSCTKAELSNLINLASDGDTIIIAHATHNWTSGVPVLVNKAVTISGGGSYAVNGWTDTGSWPTQLNTGSGNIAFRINCSSGGNNVVRITGIHFYGHGPFEYSCYSGTALGGTINILTANATRFRIDNCKFHDPSPGDSASITIASSHAYGLIDHVYFYYEYASLGHMIYIVRCGDSLAWGENMGEGDDSFTDPVDFGTEHFVFIEDSILFTAQASEDQPKNPVDGQGGGRWVLRHSKVRNGHITKHGTESGAPIRGSYASEVYNNTFLFDGNLHTAFYDRGGPTLAYNNTASGFQTFVRTWTRRIGESWGRFGRCDTSVVNNWDGQGSTGGLTGHRCLDSMGSGQASHSNINDPNFRQQTQKSYYWNNSFSGDSSSVVCTSRHNDEMCFNDPLYSILGTDYEWCDDASCAEITMFLQSYSAYTYPHPLTQVNNSGNSSLSPPRNFRVVE